MIFRENCEERSTKQMNTTTKAMNMQVPESWDEDSWESTLQEQQTETKLQGKPKTETNQERRKRLKNERETRIQERNGDNTKEETESRNVIEQEKNDREARQQMIRDKIKAMKDLKRKGKTKTVKTKTVIDMPDSDSEPESDSDDSVEVLLPTNKSALFDIVVAKDTPKSSSVEVRPPVLLKQIDTRWTPPVMPRMPRNMRNGFKREYGQRKSRFGKSTPIKQTPVKQRSAQVPFAPVKQQQKSRLNQTATPIPLPAPLKKSRWGSPIQQTPVKQRTAQVPSAPVKQQQKSRLDNTVTPIPLPAPLKSCWGPPIQQTPVNAWAKGAPKIVPCPDPDVILANIPKAQPPQMTIEVSHEVSQEANNDEWNSIRTQGFEIMKDPEKRKAILHKTCFCRYGANCQRVKNGINCDFYHSEEERKIPMCPFKHTCRSRKCNHCHPGQEQEWLQKNPLPSGCPKSAPKSAPKYVQKLGPVKIDALLFKTNPDAANLAMQAAMHSGREVMIVQ